MAWIDVGMTMTALKTLFWSTVVAFAWFVYTGTIADWRWIVGGIAGLFVVGAALKVGLWLWFVGKVLSDE